MYYAIISTEINQKAAIGAVGSAFMMLERL